MGKGTQADWTRHAGNISDTITPRVSASLGETLSYVTSVSCTLHERITGATVSLAAAVTDSDKREVTVQLGTWLQNTAAAGGWYYITLEIVTDGGSTITFPETLSMRPTLSIV